MRLSSYAKVLYSLTWLVANKGPDIPEVDFPRSGWQHVSGMLWCLCTSGTHCEPSGLWTFLWTSLICAHRWCLWTAGGSWGVTRVPEGDHRRAAYGMTSFNPDASPEEQRLCTEMCACANMCAWGRGSWCQWLLPQSPVCPPKRGTKVFAAISVQPHASPLTFRENIHFLF